MSHPLHEHAIGSVRRRLRISLLVPMFSLLALVWPLASDVMGGEAPREVAPELAAKPLIEEIKGLRKAKDTGAMRKALERLVPLHNALANKPLRHQLQHVAGQVLTDKKLGAERIVAAEALGKLNDPRGALKHLKPALPKTKTEAAAPVELAAIRAVGALAPDRAIPTLVDLMSRGKDLNVSKAAVVALGAFAKSKKRGVVLKELVDCMRRSKPQYTPGKRVGVATRARWAALGRPLVQSLNQLTGQNIRSADEWFDFYKTYKKKPKELFVDED